MSCLVAQAYDGASVMSSCKNGVQARVREKYPNATYACALLFHVLKLVVSSGCRKVPAIRNLFDSVEKLTWFIGGSAKRNEIFIESTSCESDQECIDALTEFEELPKSSQVIKEGGKKKAVPKFCATRWSAIE